MNPKNVAIWTLSFALVGALGETPNVFVGRVLSGAIIFAACTLIVCAVVNGRRHRVVRHP